MKRNRPSVGLLAFALLFVACTAAATPSPVPPTPSPVPTATALGTTVEVGSSSSVTATPTRVPPATVGIQPTPSSKAQITPARILAQAAAVRGLEPTREVAFSTLSSAELRPYLVKLLDQERGKEELAKSQALWGILDLIDEKDDLYDLWLSLLSEQLAGFYELNSHTMKLISNGSALSTMDEITLAHEYVHALQDQHFDLGARVKQANNDGEKGLALQALLEGDATLAMLDYARKNVSKENLASLQNEVGGLDMQKLRSAPLVLQISMVFPYQQGTAFVGRLFQSGGWAAVNKAYADPPITSEQIIHPEKYMAKEGPKPVEMPDIGRALGRDWLQLESSAYGELGWLVYLANQLDPEQAISASEGWGGDQYLLFRSSSGKHALAILSVWDTDDDADELFYSLWDLQDTYTETKYTVDEDTRFAWTRLSTSGYAGIKGRQVLLVITPDEATTKKIVELFTGF